MRIAATLAGFLLLAGPAAADQPSDDALVAACAKEVRERFLPETAPDHVVVASSAVTRGAVEDLVRVSLASGEGRGARATCKFRGGKLFDVIW